MKYETIEAFFATGSIGSFIIENSSSSSDNGGFFDTIGGWIAGYIIIKIIIWLIGIAIIAWIIKKIINYAAIRIAQEVNCNKQEEIEYTAQRIAQEIRKNNGELARQIAYELKQLEKEEPSERTDCKPYSM